MHFEPLNIVTSPVMKNTLSVFPLITFMCFAASSILAQQVKESEYTAALLSTLMDELTYSWDSEAELLESYGGLAQFCRNKNYRDNIMGLLNDIHHYDSLLYDKVLVLAEEKNDGWIFKLIDDIESFEDGYSMRGFMAFLETECKERKFIERHEDELRSEVASESYDGQVILLERMLATYIHHITHRVDKIRKHMHKVHFD